MISLCRRSAVIVSVCFALLLVAFAGSTAHAQTPVVMPNTITTIFGGAAGVASVASSPCPTNPQLTAVDAIGDGCPAVSALGTGLATGSSGTSVERSMVVDPQGNVYFINSSTNPQSVRRIDQRTGIVSIYAGFAAGGSLCSSGVTVFGTAYTQTDKTGSGCPVAYSGGFNGGNGMGMTPYGNVILTVSADFDIQFICNAVSPLCTAAQARVKLMRNIGGCTPSATTYGTAVSGTTAGSAGDGTPAVQLSGTCTVGINSPRQAVGDQWENVYFADTTNQRIRVILGVSSITVNGNAVPNPLYAVLATSTGSGLNYSTPVQGDIYPIAGGGTLCSSGSTDAGGDGCPFYQTVVATSSAVQGLAVESAGDFLFTDGLGRLRVIYMGGAVMQRALLQQGISSPQIGFSYALMGNGLGSAGVTGGTSLFYNTANFSPAYNLGKNVSLQSGSTQRIAVDSAGNIYIGDQAQILFYDVYTGNVHRFGGATTATSCNASAIGDGCPITSALVGAANLITSLAFDGSGNLYIQDLNNKSIRRVSATLLPTSAVSGSLTSKVVVHAPVAASGIAVTALSGTDFAVATPSCATTSTDGANECSAVVTYTPTQLAQRNVPLSIVTTVAAVPTTTNTGLAANSTGSALVFDTATAPSTTVFSTGATGNTTLIMDGAGNQYVSGTQGVSRITGNTVTNISATPAAYIAVDTQGNVYAANAGATSITKYSYSAATSTYTTGSVAIPLIAIGNSTIQGDTGPMVVDAFGTIYIADTTNLQLIRFVPGNGLGQQVTQTALVTPTFMSADTYGNLLIVDGTSILKIPAAGLTISASSPIVNPKYTFTTPLVAPTAVAADQGGNIYVADSGNIIALSASGVQYTIPNITGSGVVVDGMGNLYTSISTTPGVTKVTRNAESHDFGTDVSTPYVGVFLNTGGNAATALNQTDTGGNYSFLTPTTPLATAGTTCNFSVATALAAGGLCNISIQFAPSAIGSGPVPNLITIVPTPTLGSLSLTGTKNGSTATTTTAITGNTTSLIYTTGLETTFTVTVSQSIGTPSGVVAVQIDGGTAVNFTLVAATASTATAAVTITGLTATSHTIAANYAGSSGIAGSTATTVNFSIGQASTSVSWTPGSTTQQVSRVIGTSALNATSVGSIPGAFIYTATPTSGPAVPVDASTNTLAIGNYTLSVAFTPTDTLDYTGSTASGGTYTVTQATTTAPIGTSQFVVASNGSGNFSSVQAAVNAVGAAGGSVYVRPGTYTGPIFVVQPNVSFRGLGGDPTAVILTNEAGSFGGTGVNAYAGEFTAAQNNGSQLPGGSTVALGDEASATLIVARSTNTAVSPSQLTPFNFYAENLTINNTFDTDTVTQTTTQSNGTACVTNAGAAASYNTLFNTGKLCASQALAMWITGDQAVFNNVYSASLQDTIYSGSGGCGSPCTVSRQYWWKGKITGTVDYIFGDSAAVFDHNNIYTLPHGTGITGAATIEAQNKMAQTGSGADYLSGYVFNHTTFTSLITGMTGLVYGRPYGPYSTMVLINSYVDQVAPAGWIEFSGDTNLPTSTYVEYNTTPYTDPATGSPDVNGIIYTGTGGSTGAGVTGTREVTSLDPGYAFASNTIKTQITAAQAAQFLPLAFLSTKVGVSGGDGTLATGSTAIWDPTVSLTNSANAFVPANAPSNIAFGSSITILMRPQTPGYGILPTGTYTLTDTVGGTPSTLASGTLDASGEAYVTTSTLASGVHNLTWVYGGDTNFAGSATVTPVVITVAAPVLVNTTTTLSVTGGPTSTYGQTIAGSVTVTPASGSIAPSGTVTLLVDSVSAGNCTLTGGTCTYSLTGVTGGGHTLVASYGGDPGNNPSSSTGMSITVNKEGSPILILGTVAFSPAASEPSGTNQAIVLSDTLNYVGVLAPSGAVTFVLNTVSYPATCVGTGGLQTCSATVPGATIAALAVNTYPVTVSLAADTNYSTVSGTSSNFTIGKLTPTFGTVTFSPAATESYGSSVAITISDTLIYAGASAPTGAVSFTLNSVSYPATCTGSVSPLTCSTTTAVPAATIAALTVNSYTVAAAFAGDTNYNTATGTSGTFNITKATPVFGTMTFSPAATEPFGTSQSITISDTLTYPSTGTVPTGGVTFVLNGVSYNPAVTGGGGSVTYSVTVPAATIAALPTTGYSVSAVLATDLKYNTATGAPGTFVIGKATQTIIFGAPTAVTYGVAPITLSATGGASTNPVTFSIVGGGTGSGSLSGTNNTTLTVTGAGTIFIAANQTGNTNFNAATAVQQTLTVNKATTTFGTMSFSPASTEPLNTSQIITITDTLAYTAATAPTGTVTFTLNSVGYPATCTGSVTPLTCTASVPAATIAALAVNVYTVTAAYTTDANYSAATGTSGTFTIGTIAPSVATVSAIAVPFGSTTGITVVATESGSSGAVTGGVVTFGKTGGATGAFSPATCTLTVFGTCTTTYTPTGTLAAGTYTNTITASFGAIGGYLAANGTSTLTVVQDAVAVTLAQTAPTSAGTGTGQSTTFTATVTDGTIGTAGTPTGNVKFFDGSTLLGTSALTSGVATLSTTFTATGTHSITAVYQGDTNFVAGVTSNTVGESVVTPGFTAVANPSSLTIHQGQTGTTVITFTPVGGYQGTLNLACTGLPASASCIFTPSTIVFSGDNSVQTAELQVITLSGNAVIGGSASGLLWLPAGMLACLVAMRRRKLVRGLRPLLMLAIAALALTAMTGCGASNSPSATPLGSSTTVVTASTTAGGTGSPAVSISITIIP